MKINIPFKRYELSVSKGFDTLDQLYQYLDEVKEEIRADAGMTEGILTGDHSGEGFSVEINEDIEVVH